MSALSTRLLRAVTRVLPPQDRFWGEALLAEVDEIPVRRRPQWLMGLMPLVVNRAWRRLWAGAQGSLGRDPSTRDGAGVGLVVGGVVAAGLTYTNLGPPSRHPQSDSATDTLLAYFVLGCILVGIGFVGRGRGRSVADCARTALACAVVLTLITFATSLVIDNVWLSVVARQPDKIYGLRHSSLFHDMRAYVNAMNVIGLVIATPLGAAVGCSLGAVGALLRGRLGIGPRVDERAAE